MTIGFILNGEDVIIRCEENIRLIDILRSYYNLQGAKAGCYSGKCGFCAVLFNGKVSHACLIPAFRLPGSEIITIEGFSVTDEYQDIVAGFNQTGFYDCGYCINSKILTAGNLLDRIKRPSRKQIFQAFNGINCRCTDSEKLIEGIDKAVEIRHRRLYGRST